MQAEEPKHNHNLSHFKASMVLAAVGDAMGYKNGEWEFLMNSKILHEKMMSITNNKGPLALEINMNWKYSDDTVMHMATAYGLLASKKNAQLAVTCQHIAKEYKKCWGKMGGRAPGKTTGKMVKVLQQDGSNWNKIPYNQRGGGCGGSMRSACIGLAFHDNLDKLIGVSIQSGRMTHHNPLGFLGSMVSSYFTSLGIKGIHPNKWASYLFEEGFPISEKYVKNAGREVKQNFDNGHWEKFVQQFSKYCEKRNISISLSEEKKPKFPEEYGVVEREHFYKTLAMNGNSWPGALGLDSVLIAYDALLSSNGVWQQVCLRGILHGGDNDTTGTIAGAWFGAYYGWTGVPKNHYQQLEDGKKLMVIGQNLFNMK